MKKNKKMNNKGFSLVELIIVIAIMVILAAVLVPTFMRFLTQARVSNDISNADLINDAVAAMITEDATDGTATNVAPYTTETGDEFTIKDQPITDAEILKAIGGKNIKVDADSTYAFYVNADRKGNVTVYVSDGSKKVVLSPLDRTNDAFKQSVWNTSDSKTPSENSQDSQNSQNSQASQN